METLLNMYQLLSVTILLCFDIAEILSNLEIYASHHCVSVMLRNRQKSTYVCIRIVLEKLLHKHNKMEHVRALEYRTTV